LPWFRKEVSVILRLPRARRLAAPAAAALGAVALLLGGLPSHAQQGVPSVQLSCPATAAQGLTTNVTLSFSLPGGFRLARNPRLRVTEAGGKLTELLSTFLRQGKPVRDRKS